MKCVLLCVGVLPERTEAPVVTASPPLPPPPPPYPHQTHTRTYPFPHLQCITSVGITSEQLPPVREGWTAAEESVGFLEGDHVLLHFRNATSTTSTGAECPFVQPGKGTAKAQVCFVMGSAENPQYTHLP